MFLNPSLKNYIIQPKKEIILPQIGLSALSRNGFPVAGNIVAAYHMGNADGLGNPLSNSPFPNSIVDLAGNNHNIALNGFAGTTASGAVGDNTSGNESGLKFDGSGDYCTIAHHSDFNTENFTYVLATTKETVDIHRGYISKMDGSNENNYYFKIDADGNLYRNFVKGDVDTKFIYTDVTAADENIKVMTYTWSDSAIRLYNGSSLAIEHLKSTSTWGNISYNSHDINIGRVPNWMGWASYMTDVLHFLVIYNKELSSSEVSQAANANLVWA